MTSHLQTLLTVSSSFERAVITSPQGILLADYPPDPEVLGHDFSSRDWYRGVSRQWTPYVSDYYQQMAEPRNLVFSLAIPIKSQDKPHFGHTADAAESGLLSSLPGTHGKKKGCY